MKIGNRLIDDNSPVFIIAEMSGNHGHDYRKALELVHAAKTAGADAIKLQTYTADTITLRCDSQPFQIKGTIFEGRTLHDLYSEAFTPWDWQPKLMQAANDLGLLCFSSPFDFSSVDFLEEMNVPAYKIASYELVDLPLIEKVARTGKPIILSTGMATLEEIREAVTTATNAGATEIALLRCTSAVPAPLEEMNLRSILKLKEAFGTVVGLSDHSLGIVAPIAAVALGARIIEKHIKLDDTSNDPDSSFSLTQREFAEMVVAIRNCEKTLGSEAWEPVSSDEVSRRFRRSLFAVKEIAAGEPFTPDNVRSIRPGDGLHTRHYQELLGHKAAHLIRRGTPLSWSDVAGS